MAISPVSDIVLEVARAADPTSYRAAAARLGHLAGDSGPQPETFENELKDVPARPTSGSRMPFDPALALVRMRSGDASRPQLGGPYEQFEGFVLQTFIESMLPAKGEVLFGAGTAGQVWKSMLAEALGAQLARTGGIGIARMLAAHEPGRPASDGSAEASGASNHS